MQGSIGFTIGVSLSAGAVLVVVPYAVNGHKQARTIMHVPPTWPRGIKREDC